MIEAEDVEAICANQISGKIFDMVDAIGRKEKKKALDLYYDLLMLKEPAMRILFLITRHFQILMQLREMIGGGFDYKCMASKVGVPEFAVRKYAGQARAFDSETAGTDCTGVCTDGRKYQNRSNGRSACRRITDYFHDAMIQFTRAIRKTPILGFSAVIQLFLLIKRRSLCHYVFR